MARRPARPKFENGPMLAEAGTLPPDDEHWAYEMKWDGVRALLDVTPSGVRITSRLGNDVTGRYPELQPLGGALAPLRAVLDGEIVALDDSGRPSFGLLQNRMHADPRKAQQFALSMPVVLMLFDVLELDGNDVTALPYTERRALLERLHLAGANWQTPPVQVGGGRRVLDTAQRLGLEGIVAKRLDSPYVRGRRSAAWRKVKITAQQEFVVGGWIPGEGRLETTVGALVVGYYDGTGGPLRYAGRVGSGLDDATRDRYTATLRARPTCPFEPPPPAAVRRVARWVEPELVVEVRFTMWTTDDVLRNPVYLGERDDKDPAEVVREPTPGV
ncbi:MAG TPA: non-homologous end-joining DNA ligase [Acidimicrobiia bacterium]|nr:non-homologous end-joining DNA ligase [Acidimicrobiia bacterium]